MADVAAVLSRCFRDEGGRIRGALMRAIGDLALVEDALAAAAEQALITWPTSGVPQAPGAWLTTVAKKKAIDVVRKRKRFADKEHVLAALAEEGGAVSSGFSALSLGRDDRLQLLFVACHPILPEEERVALTLQVVGGLSAAEVARAFLVPVTTMEKRLARAKQKLAAARVPFEVPSPEELPARREAVLAVLYLIFNEGYLASKGDAVIRHELCDEALRLLRLLTALLPDEEAEEAIGLLALMLFTHARRRARVDDAGEIVLLEDQDRSIWDRQEIADATKLIDGVLERRRPGPYQIQAAIAALHAQAPSTSETDWAQIAALYAALIRHLPTPVVRLNHAVAVAMAHGLDAGLSLLEVLGREGELESYALYWSTRGELLRRRGDVGAAKRAFQRARTLAHSPAERAFLTRKLEQLPRST